jgi:hypothetical protein
MAYQQELIESFNFGGLPFPLEDYSLTQTGKKVCK